LEKTRGAKIAYNSNYSNVNCN